MITYFHRNPAAGISIEKVSSTYIAEIKKTEDVEEFIMPMVGASIKSIFTNLIFTYKHRNKHGVNHITGDIHYCLIAVPRKKSILTIHDCDSLYSTKGIKRCIIKLIWYTLPIMRASQIICISNYTNNQLLEQYPWASKKTTVIYNAIGNDYLFAKPVNNVKPIVLHIGTKTNKNLDKVIYALKGIDMHLRIIGNLTPHQVELITEAGISYSSTSNISEQDMIKEYVRCDIVSFPSLYEGFGMPQIEAQAIGRPVLISNIPPLVEISNGSAYCVDPLNINSIRNGFVELLNNKIMREQFVKSGMLNASRFTSVIIASEYLRIYRNIEASYNSMSRA